MAKCKNCRNFNRAITSDNEYICNWCEKIKDNPHEEIERECEYYECMTNADRIRSMDDEELARFLNSNCPSCTEFCDEFDGGCMFECRYNRGDDIILKWLKSEVGCE